MSSHNRPLTDSGNAERFAYRHGQHVRYCTSWGCWLVWDGLRWARDLRLDAPRRAKETARLIYAEAAKADDDAKRDRLATWAKASESATRIDSMLKLARSESGITITADQLDADPWAPNTLSGIVDLRTGELRDATPGDLCAKLAPSLFTPAAKCPRFERFLERIFAHDHELISYVQRLIGVFLTGDISEQVFPVFYGEGANGKSVLTDLIASLLGDYTGQAPESLVTVNAGSDHPTELADLQGRRLVIATETEQGKRLRVGLIKKMTGDMRMKGRFMRQDFFEFDRTHKTILVTNHRPEVSETKNAIWRRMHLVPFTVTIPPAEQDKGLLRRLIEDEGPGVLAWAVRGCLEWQRYGLNPPDAVLAATEEYRLESDPLGDFLSDCCFVGPDSSVSRKSIAETYGKWCRDVAERGGLTRQGLYERLRDHADVSEGWLSENGKRTRGFNGIAVVSSRVAEEARW